MIDLMRSKTINKMLHCKHMLGDMGTMAHSRH